MSITYVSSLSFASLQPYCLSFARGSSAVLCYDFLPLSCFWCSLCCSYSLCCSFFNTGSERYDEVKPVILRSSAWCFVEQAHVFPAPHHKTWRAAASASLRTGTAGCWRLYDGRRRFCRAVPCRVKYVNGRMSSVRFQLGSVRLHSCVR